MSSNTNNNTEAIQIQQATIGNPFVGYILVTLYGLNQSTTIYLIRGTAVATVTNEVQLIWTHCLALLVSLILMLIFEQPV